MTLGVYVLYTWCVNNLTAQFKVVQSKIASLALLEQPLNAAALPKEIQNCVQLHQQVIDLVAQLNRGFWLIILTKFLLNSGQICFICYQIGRGADAFRIPFLLSYVVFIVAEMLLYCYAGQQLEEEVSTISK